LDQVYFFGNAPSMGDTVFPNPTNRPGLRLYYYSGKSGFTTPVWTVNLVPYSTINMGAESPIKTWLITAGLPYDSDLQSDSNQDGVNLLMAYALGLNPNQNQSGSMPSPLITGSQMSLRYYAGSAGVTYSVESSSDLKTWTTNGVTLSAQDASHYCTATVSMTGANCFLRLVVSH
jgi:hypothetical protein